MKQQLQFHQNTVTSILKRQAKLTNRPNELQFQVDLLDDYGQMSHSLSRVRNDISLVSSRGNHLQRSTPALTDENKDSQLQRDTNH